MLCILRGMIWEELGVMEIGGKAVQATALSKQEGAVPILVINSWE